MVKKTCMPPNKAPITPNFELPKNATDAHCHVFGPHEVFPFHPKASYWPPDNGKEELKKIHEAIGIERAVIVQASCHGIDNRAMMDALANNPDTYRGVCIADDSFSRQDFETLNDGGVCGVRFNFVKHLGGAPDLDKMQKVLDKVIPLGWHLVIHVNAEDLIEYESFFSQLDMPIVVDHMGRVPTDLGVEQEAFQILKRFVSNENWWVKVSGAERISKAGPPFEDAIPYAKELISIAPKRVLWGTDFPHPNIKTHMPNDGHLVNLLNQYCDTREQLEDILVHNPAKLYNW